MISAVNRRPLLNGNNGLLAIVADNLFYMKKAFFYVLFLTVIIPAARAQDSVLYKHKIAIFAPLYLDSAFDATNEYRYEKNVFPKFINPGLEFYEGAQLALDSLDKEGAHLEIFVFDTRSSRETLDQQLSTPGMQDVS